MRARVSEGGGRGGGARPARHVWRVCVCGGGAVATVGALGCVLFYKPAARVTAVRIHRHACLSSLSLPGPPPPPPPHPRPLRGTSHHARPPHPIPPRHAGTGAAKDAQRQDHAPRAAQNCGKGGAGLCGLVCVWFGGGWKGGLPAPQLDDRAAAVLHAFLVIGVVTLCLHHHHGRSCPVSTLHRALCGAPQPHGRRRCRARAHLGLGASASMDARVCTSMCVHALPCGHA